MPLARSYLCFLLWILLAGGAVFAGGEETPFAQVIPSIAILEWESASPGSTAKPIYTTAVAVSLSDGRTAIASSCAGLGRWRPAAALVREDHNLSRLAVETIGIDLSTGLAVVSSAWKPAQAIGISDSVSPAVGERLYFIGADARGELELAEGFVCESDIRQVGILRYERLTRTCCSLEHIPAAAAAFDSQGRLFGFVVEAPGRRVFASYGQRYVNPTRAWTNELEELSRTGKVSRAWLGLTLRQHLDKAGKKAGAVVAQVLPDSPAQKAGIAPGDHIIAYESGDARHELCCVTDLTFEIASMKPGTTVQVHLEREGRKIALPVALEVMPESLTPEGEARWTPPRSADVGVPPSSALSQHVILAGTLEGVAQIIESATGKRVILEMGADPGLAIRLEGAFADGNALERAFLKSIESRGLACEASDSEIRIHKASK
ncbi:MAG: PDZ domain-containing protein [Planctomycetota bacterium]